MRDVPGLDSVVRHDGEETLVEMLDMLAKGQVAEGHLRASCGARATRS